MLRLMLGKRGHKPGREIVETNECDIGRTFNYRLCLIRHFHKRRLVAEGKLIGYDPCTHCPLILKAIEKEKNMQDKSTKENESIKKSFEEPSEEIIQARRREYSGIPTMGVCYRCGKSAILEVDTKLCYHCSVEKDASSHTIADMHVDDLANTSTFKAGKVARCKHCHKDKRIRGRGLCASCYSDISIRNRFSSKNTGRPPKERTTCRGCGRYLTTVVDGVCPKCAEVAKNLGLTDAVKKDKPDEALLNQVKISLEYTAHLIGLLLKKGTD